MERRVPIYFSEAPTKQGPRPCSSEHGVPNRRRNEKDNARRDTRSKRCSCACPAFGTQIGDANAAARHQQGHGGTIRLEAWLYAVPSDNALSATVWDRFKITGAVNDEGGGPTWTDEASYTAPNSMTTGGQAAAAKECAAKNRPAASVPRRPQNRASTASRRPRRRRTPRKVARPASPRSTPSIPLSPERATFT